MEISDTPAALSVMVLTRVELPRWLAAKKPHGHCPSHLQHIPAKSSQIFWDAYLSSALVFQKYIARTSSPRIFFCVEKTLCPCMRRLSLRKPLTARTTHTTQVVLLSDDLQSAQFVCYYFNLEKKHRLLFLRVQIDEEFTFWIVQVILLCLD